MTNEFHAEEVRKAGFEDGEKPLNSLDISRDGLGQRYPHHYPHPDNDLGEPLTIQAVAELLGCSAWTVRHAYLPKGLPYLRSGPQGKLVFFHTQVVRWILEHQRKGGK